MHAHGVVHLLMPEAPDSVAIGPEIVHCAIFHSIWGGMGERGGLEGRGGAFMHVVMALGVLRPVFCRERRDRKRGRRP